MKAQPGASSKFREAENEKNSVMETRLSIIWLAATAPNMLEVHCRTVNSIKL
jgi:hypothetical protein